MVNLLLHYVGIKEIIVKNKDCFYTYFDQDFNILERFEKIIASIF